MLKRSALFPISCSRMEGDSFIFCYRGCTFLEDFGTFKAGEAVGQLIWRVESDELVERDVDGDVLRKQKFKHTIATNQEEVP